MQDTRPAPQRVIAVRRQYNRWVARETLEDYALRFTPQRARRWTAARVANTAFGAAAFLILEAVGATLLLQYGWTNALCAILATGLVIALAGVPISVYAARHGVDMDLLTRGAGFGYLGSTLTSLLYASFTFIFFALEAAVMAYALDLALDIPPRWGYLLCALVVLPLVTHGVAAIGRLQALTQPLWLLLLVLPYAALLAQDGAVFAGAMHHAGAISHSADFELRYFGAALTVGIALVTQLGEQADYLRFMPALPEDASRAHRCRWWGATLLGGIGWVLPGVLKMLGGALLAWLALSRSVPAERAVDPNQMYLAGFEALLPRYGWAVAATALFVLISQLKINVTNAYAGSLAWSNFFSRLTHSHPGRVVWVGFNLLIAVLLMEMQLFDALAAVLALYANLAVAWMGAVVADLLINKPLGLSPPGIEFRRAMLYDINPVGVGAMALASLLSVAAYLGWLGELAQAFSALIALLTALLSAPLIAWATGGRYYLARRPEAAPQAARLRCVICERRYEAPDMSHCPAYQGPICSLCCSLDARCDDLCKPQARLSEQWAALLRRLLPSKTWPYLDMGLAQFLLLQLCGMALLGAALGLLYQQEAREIASEAAAAALRSGLLKAFVLLSLGGGVAIWWLVLARQSGEVARQESRRQTEALMQEIASHQRTDAALQQARDLAREAQAAAEAANQAKSRYVSAISHELRTPLNSILGYTQLMADDAGLPPRRRQAVQVIQRSGEHLLSLIDHTLDLARIEAGRLSLQPGPMQFEDEMHELAALFEPQAAARGLRFVFAPLGTLPALVRADAQRVRQVLFNLLGNAIKFTERGQVVLRVSHLREMACFEIEDSGPGLSAEAQARIFEPFERAGSQAPGAGLGLSIARALVELMGGELRLHSKPGQGCVFSVRLYLPVLNPIDTPANKPADTPIRAARSRRGHAGPPRRLLIVDNEAADRQLLLELLTPLGFELRSACNGHDAIDLVSAGWRPDALLLDLAMPGIDGWTTLRRLRPLLGPALPCAIISANAFEKEQALAPELGETAFFTKPLRHAALLDWLGERLQLQWLEQPTQDCAHTPHASADPAKPADKDAIEECPEPALCAALREALELGYPRGVQQALEAAAAAQPALAPLWQRWRAQAARYDYAALLAQLPAAEARR